MVARCQVLVMVGTAAPAQPGVMHDNRELGATRWRFLYQLVVIDSPSVVRVLVGRSDARWAQSAPERSA